MTRLPIVLGLAALLGLTACVPTTPVETCSDPSGATYIKPVGGCPALVAVPVYKKRVAVPAPIPVRVKPPPVPVVERSGGDGGSDGGSGWGGG